MVFVCPHQQCGRKFEQEGPMIEHVRRRHPEHMEKLESLLSKTIMFADRRKQDDIAKLPRLKLRQSQPKDSLKETVTLPQNKPHMKPSQIISNTRMEVRAMEAADTGKSKLLKVEPQRLGSRGSLKEESASQQPSASSQLMTPKNDFRRNVLRRKSSKDVLERVGSDDKKELQDRLGTAATANDFSSVKLTESNKGSDHSALNKLTTGRLVIKGTEVAAEKPIIRISKSKQKHKLFTPSSTSTSNLFQKRPQSKSKIEPQEPIVSQPIVAKVKTEEAFDLSTLEPTPTLIIKKHMKVFSPPFSCIEYLFLNGCGLTTVSLEGLELLREFSATHNQLTSMQCIVYEGNDNLAKVHLDNNHISELLLPKNLELLTMPFNKLENLDQLTNEISRSSSLDELDLSFNPVKRLYNYKYQLLLKGKHLKKLDGLKITKYDIDLALQYKSMVKREKQQTVQKSNARYYDRFQRRIKQDYSYAIAQKLTEQQYEKLRKEQEQYLTRIDQLQANMNVITTENSLLEEELAAIHVEQSGSANINVEHAMLQAEVETLEMLNMLQFADQEELMQLIQAAQAKL